ncbi:MAG: hypothetical protein AMXMBFR13_31960 [Phycisphaerae bacterium]
MNRTVPGILALITSGALSPAWAELHTFPTPSHDRWHYPFNFTPGSRVVGSCFGAVGDPDFNDRDAYVIVAWQTSSQIAAGQGADAYGVRSVRITVANTSNAAWPVDLSVDEWFTTDVNGDGTINGDGIPRGELGDTDGESDDSDPGRPVELYGVGFGPFYTAGTWSESSLFVGSGGDSEVARDPYPFVFRDDSTDRLHVEDHVDGFFNESFNIGSFTPVPWAIGLPLDYTPGMQSAPFEVVFDVDLGLSGGQVRRYFQEAVNRGTVFVILSSVREATLMGPQAGYPSFYLQEGAGIEPGAAAPRLDVHVCPAVAPDADRDCDVDFDDVDAFTACQRGPSLPVPASCDWADFDKDSDVDQDDYGVFQRCFSGQEEPDPNCAGASEAAS